MAVTQHGDKLNLTAAADLSLKQYYLAVQTNDTSANLAGANANVLGPILNKPRLGETVSIANALAGATFKVKINGTVSVGTKLVTDANGLAVAVTQSIAGAQPNQNVFAEALQAGVVNDIIEVRGVRQVF